MILNRALFYHRTLFLSDGSITRTGSIMQPSITSFFKIRPAKDQVDDSNQVDDSDDQAKEQQPPAATGDSERDSPTNGDKKSTASRKRAIDSDDDVDDDDEDVVKTTRNKKRPTLLESESESEGTPVKMSAPAVTASTGDAPKGDEHASVKSPLAVAKPMFIQKPMLQAQIEGTISCGAYALHKNIGLTWFKALQPEFSKPYFKTLSTFLKNQRDANTVYPPEDKVFTWTHYHDIRDTRVVIIGQDPYHNVNQAHGLSFSVQKGVEIPASLKNIFAELKSDIPDFKKPNHGELVGWAKQGVLLLNACLTVRAHAANSHQHKGWEKLTDATISWISKNVAHKVVFLLWGRFAQQKSSLIDKRHKILTAAHPSPLSAHNGFLGCKHFSQTNAFLKSQKLPEIDWSAL